MNYKDIKSYQEQYYKKHGRFPESLPVTRQEYAKVNSNSSIEHALNPLKMEITPFGPELRTKRVSLKYAVLQENATIPIEVFNDAKLNVELIRHEMICNMEAKILSDTEVLEIEIEVDPWTKWKKIFNIKPKKKKINIEARTLYSRLSIKFPENSHSVTFNILES